ncbi:MAG: LAGLIDADG family homing endonuclease [Candidatus Hadarchaeales archaeon]
MYQKERDWILGYLEAKGSFTFNMGRMKDKLYQNPVFFLSQKEREPLLLLRDLTGLGEVRKVGGLYRWEIRKKKEVIMLVEFLEGGFRTPAKQRQYEKWKEAVLQWKQRGRS